MLIVQTRYTYHDKPRFLVMSIVERMYFVRSNAVKNKHHKRRDRPAAQANANPITWSSCIPDGAPNLINPPDVVSCS